MNLTPLNILALDTLVFNRLKSDAEGASVRAVLGVGADGVQVASKLRTFLPAPPYVALRRNAPARRGNTQRVLSYTWYVCDMPSMGYERIRQLLPLIAAAYNARTLYLPTTAAINAVDVDDGGAEGEDRALKSLVIQQSITIYL